MALGVEVGIEGVKTMGVPNKTLRGSVSLGKLRRRSGKEMGGEKLLVLVKGNVPPPPATLAVLTMLLLLSNAAVAVTADRS